MLESVATQLSRVTVMTPSTLVPALSNSCAAALSSTPAMSSAIADQVIAPASSQGPWLRPARSSPAHDHAPRVAGEDLHRHPTRGQALEVAVLHHGIALRESLPDREPF